MSALDSAGVLQAVREVPVPSVPREGINARGLSALDSAGVLQAVREVSVPREGMALHLPDGSIKFVPRGPPTIGISRPRLIAKLTEIIEAEGNAKIRRNYHVTGFVPNKDGTLQVNLS